MHLSCCLRRSVLLFVGGLSVPSFASTLPFNLAPNAPLGNEETVIYTDAAGNPTSGVGVFYIPSLSSFGAGATPVTQSGSTTFAYTLNPGWSEGLGDLSLDIEYGITPLPGGTYAPNAGIDVEEELVLCPAAGECESTSRQVGFLTGALPPLVAGPLAPGTGEILYSEYALMAQGEQAPGTGGLDIYYTYSPVPEPSSVLLLATGTLGLLGATRRRLTR